MIQRVRKIFETNIVKMRDKEAKNSIIKKFEIFIQNVQGKLLTQFNQTIAQVENFEKIQNEVESFEKNLNKSFNDVFEKILPISRIRSAHDRFFKRKNDPKKFATARKPRIAGPLNVSNSIIDTPTKMAKSAVRGGVAKSEEPEEFVSTHQVNTPFGVTTLRVIYEEKGPEGEKYFKVFERVIVTSSGAMLYKEIFEILDKLVESNKELAKKLLNEILDYLNMSLQKGDIDNEKIANDILQRFNSRIINSEILVQLTSEQAEAAAALCSILLLCESCEIRNATGVKLERGFIKTVIKNIDIDKPFSTCGRKYPPSLSFRDNPPGGKERTRRALDNPSRPTKKMTQELIDSTVNDINDNEVSSNSDSSKNDNSDEVSE